MRCLLADCPECLAEYGPQVEQGDGTLGAMTAHQLTLPLEESATTLFKMVHLIDNEVIESRTAPTGTFEEVRQARKFAVDLQQRIQDGGLSRYEVEWELTSRPTGWYGVETNRGDGQTHVHELRIEKA